jgi:hypothetical protein
MGRRAPFTVVSNQPKDPPTAEHAPYTPKDVSEPTPIIKEERSFEFPPRLTPLLPLVKQIDPDGYFSPEDLRTIFLTQGQISRRFIGRLLQGVYQRSFSHKNTELTNLTRLHIQLHEQERLEEYLAVEEN